MMPFFYKTHPNDRKTAYIKTKIMEENLAIEQIIEKHKASGKYVTVNGIKTFALDYGSGEPVFCIHGVPTSSFLYRKVLKSLAEKGYRGICVDLPGLGLSDRPEDFEYSFLNFSRFLAEAAKELGLEKYHLVVHDIGGPIGFALAAQHPDKILSLTIFNTWIDVTQFEKPLPMRPFEKPILSDAELAMVTRATWPLMFNTLGVDSNERITNEEIKAYVDLLKREDDGKAFLKIMKNFDHSSQFRDLCYKAVQQVHYPVQAVWGAKDPALDYERYGLKIKEVAGLEKVELLPARHFLQEEQWEAVADKIEEIIEKAHSYRD